ncbi:MAG: hypothetical protein OWV35_01655 [Firmicutes bacterium]|nr:hypothetical protein [Bacillota bacterium]
MNRPARTRARRQILTGMLGGMALAVAAGCGPSAAGPSGTANRTVHKVENTAKRGTRPITGAPKGTAAIKPLSLATLPPFSYLKRFNPELHHVHEVSTFISGMGYHYATPCPGLTVMTNAQHQVTAVEAQFPQKLGSHPWFDPPTTVPNGGVAFYSEHLYFLPPGQITPGMPSNLPTDLTSKAKFWAVNTRLTPYVKEPGMFRGYTVYAPPAGPGIKVLVSSKGDIGGFLVSEPASWGWHRYYVEPKGKPVSSKLFGRAYHVALWLIPSHTAPGGGTGRTR